MLLQKAEPPLASSPTSTTGSEAVALSATVVVIQLVNTPPGVSIALAAQQNRKVASWMVSGRQRLFQAECAAAASRLSSSSGIAVFRMVTARSAARLMPSRKVIILL